MMSVMRWLASWARQCGRRRTPPLVNISFWPGSTKANGSSTSERLGRGSVDDSERHYFGSSPVCQECRHRIGHRHLTCMAFPRRIPIDIWNARHDHRTPYLGDHGVRFAPMTEEDRCRERQLLEVASARYRQMTDEMRRQRGLPPLDWEALRSAERSGVTEPEPANTAVS